MHDWAATAQACRRTSKSFCCPCEVCASRSPRRMVETAAHLTVHVFPRLPVRQWVLLVPKRLRYCARPPFAKERLRKEGAELVYRCAKQQSEPGASAAHAPAPLSDATTT